MKKQSIQLSSRKLFQNLFLMLTFFFIAASCKEDADVLPAVEPETSELNLYDALSRYNQTKGREAGVSQEQMAKKHSFSVLKVALAKSGLMGTVAQEHLTLFAPTDEAFAALGLNQQNIGSVPNLKEILLYHAVAGKVYSTDLSNGFVPTLNGAAVEIKLDGGVMVNNANVVQADIRALNGVFHAIDQVLLPPTMNLVELALSFDPQFSILVAAVQKAGLVDALATGGPYTVFAPTNEAFVALLNELGATSLDDIPVEVLTKVLLYHVVDGRVYSSDLRTGSVSTLLGQPFMVNTANLTITDANGRTANLLPSLLNVQATNGVVHVIDRVILPDLSL